MDAAAFLDGAAPRAGSPNPAGTALDDAPQPRAPAKSSAGAFLDAPGMRYDAPELDAHAKAVEQKYGLPSGLIVAIKNAGERSNADQVSPVGARGVMQFMPENLIKYGVKDPTDSIELIDASGRYLSDTMKQYGGNLRAMIADYNGGPQNAKAVLAGREPVAAETRNYLKRVEGWLSSNGMGRASSFLDQGSSGQAKPSARDFLPAQSNGEPTADEIEIASRPARVVTTRKGQTLVVPESELRARDNWDAETQGERRAPWTGEGGVMESLPGQLVAGARSAAANLRRMNAQEAVLQRSDAVNNPSTGETRGGAVSGRAAPGSLERQEVMLGRDTADLEAARLDAARAEGDMKAITPHGMNVPQQAVSSLAQSAPSTALGVAAGILTRNVPLAMAIAGGGGATQQAGTTYGEAREKGATHRVSAMAASIDAILEGVGEALPLGIALKRGSPVMTRILSTVAAEAGQEIATQLGQDLNAFLSYNPDITLKEAWHNVKVAAMAGAMGGTVYGAAGAAVDASRQRADATAQPAIAPGAPTAEALTAATVAAPVATGTMPGAAAFLDQAAVPAGTPAPNASTQIESVGNSGEVVPQSAQSAAPPVSPSVTSSDAPASPMALPDAASSAPQGNQTPASPVSPAPSADARVGAAIDTAVSIASTNWSTMTEEEKNAELDAIFGEDSRNAARPADAGAQGRGSETQSPVETAEAAAAAENDVSSTGKIAPVAIDAVAPPVVQAKKPGLTASEIPADLTITVSSVEETGKTHQVELNALGAFKVLSRRVKRLESRSLAGGMERGVDDQKALDEARADHQEVIDAVFAELPSLAERFSSVEATEKGSVTTATPQDQAVQAHRESAEALKAATQVMKDTAEALRESLGLPKAKKPGTLTSTAAEARPYDGGTETTDGIDTDRARPDAIRKAMRELFNVPINEKGITNPRALGIYKVLPQTIRVRNQNDIDTISHEIGHHFSETSQKVRTHMETHQGELLGLTPDAYASRPRKLRIEEGFAEYVRLYLTQQAQAKAAAPKFTAAFDAYLDESKRYRPIFNQIHDQIQDWYALKPAQRILAKVGGPKVPLRERLSALFDKDKMVFEVLDQYQPLKLMVKDLKPGVAPSKDPFKAAHLLAGDSAIIEDWLTTGTIPFDYTKRADPKNFGKGLRDILKPVSNDLDTFSAYLIARRADELAKQGKERLFTRDEINAGLKLETPEFKTAAEEIYAYNDSLLDYAVEGGLLAQEIADTFRKLSHAYIPFFRESADGDGRAGGKNPFKRLLGGTDNIRDPIGNVIQNTANIIHATNRNAVLIKARALAKSVPGGGRWIEEVPIPKAMLNVPTQTILDAFEEQGVTLDEKTARTLGQIQKLIVPSPVEDKAERIVIARVDGTPHALQINNEMLAKALQSFEPADFGLVGAMLAIPSDLLRAGVTLSPDFMARNFMRDTLSGFMQSKRGILPVASTLSGFYEVVTRSDAAKLYRAFGGAYADLWKGESTQARKTLERMAKRGGFDPRTIFTPGGVIELLKRLGSITEAGTRVAEFKATAKKGDVDSLIEAAYNGREVSVDFGMHGFNRNVRFLTRITPFLNPAMQGLYKMARTSREQAFLTLLRGSMLTAFSVALFMLNKDEDWYDEIETWERNVYWHMDLGFRTKDGKVIPIRIPKPFEWGAIFGSVPEALAQVAIDMKGSRFAKRLTSILTDVFGVRAVPTAVLVPLELYANRNTFTKRPIVPETKERLDPELQFNPGASLTARELGSAAGVSPAQIDHMVRGFFGTMGLYATTLADLGLREVGDYPEKPSATVREIPVVRAFVRDPDSPNTRYVTEFYDLMKKARRAELSIRQHEGDKADAYYEKNKTLIDSAPELNSAARDLSATRRETREVMESRDHTGAEKRRLINEQNARIRTIAKGVMVEQPGAR